MIKWIDINKQRPVNEQKCWIKTREDHIVSATYSASTMWFIDFDNEGRAYNMEEVYGWVANG